MNKNTINRIKKSDIGMGVMLLKYFNHSSPASAGQRPVWIAGLSYF